MRVHSEPMSAVDTAWLRMESETNLMMITAVLVLDSPVDIDHLKTILSERLLKFSRFRQKVVHQEDRPVWVEDEHFHIDNHVHVIGLPGKDSREDLQSLVSDIASTPLNLSRPLWQIQVVENYQGGSALIYRIHHCIADGMALVRVMLATADPDPQSGPAPVTDKDVPHGFLYNLVAPVAHWAERGLHLTQELLHEGVELMEHPGHLLDLAREGGSIAAELGRIAALPSDPKTCLKTPHSGRKVVAWADSLPLAQVKLTAKALGATINDVLLAAATGALRRYLLEQPESPASIDELHVAVPFNLRPLDKPITSLGNQFGLVVVPLPVGTGELKKRLQKVRESMQALKHSWQAQVFYGMLGVLGKGPSVLEQTALEVLSKKASLVMTNVPGPRHALFMAGCKIRKNMFWVPQSGEVGVGLSILSYDDSVEFGIIADKAMIPDPDKVVHAFTEEVAQLARLAAATEPAT